MKFTHALLIGCGIAAVGIAAYVTGCSGAQAGPTDQELVKKAEQAGDFAACVAQTKLERLAMDARDAGEDKAALYQHLNGCLHNVDVAYGYADGGQ